MTKRKKNICGNCCNNSKRKIYLESFFYGVIPHIGCIVFIIGSIFGSALLMNILKPFLLNKYFFHGLILISFVFATISSLFYLKKQGNLSFKGIRNQWRYLSIMYGITIGMNILLFFVIFPLIANFSFAANPITGAVVGLDGSESKIENIQIKVDIPCSGHAPLISEELKSMEGVLGIRYGFPNSFDITYDSMKTNDAYILGIDIFKTYKAELISINNKEYMINQK